MTAFTGFRAGSLSGWIGIWRCRFLRREEKSENLEKNPWSKAKTKKNLNQQMRQTLLPIDETIDIVFKNHFHFFFHLLLQMEYKNSH